MEKTYVVAMKKSPREEIDRTRTSLKKDHIFPPGVLTTLTDLRLLMAVGSIRRKWSREGAVGRFNRAVEMERDEKRGEGER